MWPWTLATLTAALLHRAKTDQQRQQAEAIHSANPVLSEPGFQEKMIARLVQEAAMDHMHLSRDQQLELFQFLAGDRPQPTWFDPAQFIASIVDVLETPPSYITILPPNREDRVALLPHVIPIQ